MPAEELDQERNLRGLRHLLGPAVVVAIVIAIFLGISALAELPRQPADSGLKSTSSPQEADLVRLLEYQHKDYKANLTKLDTNINLQALMVLVTVLLILRRADSLNLIRNSIPLSWLHVVVPVL